VTWGTVPVNAELTVERSRYGISFRLLAGLASLVLLTAAAGGLALAAFATFEDALNDVAGQYLPSLVSSATLVQETQKLAANAPALMVAESQVVRRGLVTRIAGQRVAIDAQVSQLAQHGLSAEEAETINRVETDLVDNLKKLDEAVEHRIEEERQLQNLMQEVRQLRESVHVAGVTHAEAGGATSLRTFLVHPAAKDSAAAITLWDGERAFEEWYRLVDEVLGLLLTVFEAPNKGGVDSIRLQLLDAFERIAPVSDRLSAQDKVEALEIITEMRGMALGPEGLLETRIRQLETGREQQAVLDRNRLLAGRLSSAVDGPRKTLERNVLEVSADSSMRMRKAAMRLIVIVAVCVGAAGLIVVYINRRVIRRLHGLQLSMHQHIAGQAAPIDTSGGDEIGDIATALDFFVSTISAREEALRLAKGEADQALVELKAAQTSLIHAEKLASLGQLTAGIAHEIKNPLNFVINFSSLSVELLDELKEYIGTADQAGIDEILPMLSQNLASINANGIRADSIVRGMLLHSRSSGGTRVPSDVNRLLEDAFNLTFHGARAQDAGFNLQIEWQLDRSLPVLDIVPQDIMRVFVNLMNNAFYATGKRSRESGGDYRPTIHVASQGFADRVEIRINDNGSGIPPDVRAKLFTPFFTTKPPGEGTGLGLSLCWDMVVHGHGGNISVESEVGDHTTFTVTLPLATQTIPSVEEDDDDANDPMIVGGVVAPSPT
jgi:signal transduction histidine kinase